MTQPVDVAGHGSRGATAYDTITDTDQLQQARWSIITAAERTAYDALAQMGLSGQSDTARWSSAMRAERGVAVTGRGLDEIADEHGMTPNELIELASGKRVLIIGPGYSTLGRELLDRCEPIDLTSVDVDLEALQSQPGRRVHCSAERLELPDDSFDVVLMTFALPLWAFAASEVTSSFNEVLRVTAPGGVIKIAPIGDAVMRAKRDARTGEFIGGSLSDPDPRFRAVLWQIDLATYEWLLSAARRHDLAITLDATYGRRWSAEEVCGVTIRRG